jgi:hypothetical protein
MPHLSIIPANAVADPALTDTQVRVLCAIGTFTNRLGGNVWASVQTMAKSCNLSPRTVQRALPVLVERGYLRGLIRPGRTNLYEVVLDRGMTLESSGGDTAVTPPPTAQSPKRLEGNDNPNELRSFALQVTKAIYAVYPKRDTPHLFPPALRAVTDCLKRGASPERMVEAASLYAQEVQRKQTEPRFVRTMVRFYADGAWEHYANEVRVHGRTREEWARSGQDVAEFDRLAQGVA